MLRSKGASRQELIALNTIVLFLFSIALNLILEVSILELGMSKLELNLLSFQFKVSS